MRHWFDGLAMLHRFDLGGDGVSYASRFVQSKAYRSAEATGKIGYAEFGTDPCLTLFAKVRSLFAPQISDNPNVNLTQLGDRFVSMTETPMPVEFDADTLESAGVAWKVPGLLTSSSRASDPREQGICAIRRYSGPRRSRGCGTAGRDRVRSRSRSGWGSRSRRSESEGRRGVARAWSAGSRPRGWRGRER